MLVKQDRASGQYVITILNATGWAELAADRSYLKDAPRGNVLFDFTTLSGNLTSERRLDYLPGNFGFHPTDQLAEEVSFISHLCEQLPPPHRLSARLPSRSTKVGTFLWGMRLKQALQHIGLVVVEDEIPEAGDDDPARKNLIPLTDIVLHDGCPDFAQLSRLRKRIEQIFSQALDGAEDLASYFASVISEAIDNLIVYARGGWIAGLYYPRLGEVEISLINRLGGFGGDTPQEQLEQLVSVIEGTTKTRSQGGHGIPELMNLVDQYLGTLRLSNGNASLYILPDGSMTTVIDDTGINIPGGRVTIVLQLLPATQLPGPMATTMIAAVRRIISCNQPWGRVNSP